MRRCLALSLLLVAAFARIGAAGAVAETPTPAADSAPAEVEDVTPTVQLVQVWPKTRQALMFDPIHGMYVVVSVGQTVDNFRVARIGKRQITLAEIRSDGPGHEFVLLPTPVDPSDTAVGGIVTAPAIAPIAPPPVAPVVPAPAPVTPAAPGILDPYPSDVLDPYGHDGFRVVQAPPEQRVTSPAPTPATTSPATTTPAPAATRPATPAPTLPAIPTPAAGAPATRSPAAPAITPPPAHPAVAPTSPVPARTAPASPPTRATPPSTGDRVVISRRELDAALGDFGRLTRDSQLALGTGGVAFTRVAPGSLFARVGLRDGDRLTAINGVAIRSIDDAAGLYARLGSLDHLALDVVRGAAKVALRCDLSR